MKRFYETVSVASCEGGYGITLDGKSVKTPAGAVLAVPNEALADQIAAEWEEQEDVIEPAAMGFTRLVNTAIDGVAPKHGEVVEAVARFGTTDLLCYRAEHPEALIARQAERWQPILDWAAGDCGVELVVASGIVPVDQPETSLKALHEVFAALDALTLTAAEMAASITGSAVLTLALLRGRLDLEEAWALSRLDEDWQIEKWGEDEEATERAAAKKEALAIAAEVMEIMAKGPTS